MYRVVLYDITGTTKETIFFDAIVNGWSLRINAAGRMNFSLPYGSRNATEARLQKYKRIKLMRKIGGEYTTIWYGYIEAHKRQSERIDVFCVGMLEFFKSGTRTKTTRSRDRDRRKHSRC